MAVWHTGEKMFGGMPYRRIPPHFEHWREREREEGKKRKEIKEEREKERERENTGLITFCQRTLKRLKINVLILTTALLSCGRS